MDNERDFNIQPNNLLNQTVTEICRNIYHKSFMLNDYIYLEMLYATNTVHEMKMINKINTLQGLTKNLLIDYTISHIT